MTPITGCAPPSEPCVWYASMGETVWIFVWTGERVIGRRLTSTEQLAAGGGKQEGSNG